MEDYNNALQAFGATQGSAQSYIATKREKVLNNMKSRISTAVVSQAEALGLSQEQQEKFDNLVETTQASAPVVGVAGIKAFKYLKNRYTNRASASATKPSSVTSTTTQDTGDAGKVAEGEEGTEMDTMTGGGSATSGSVPSEQFDATTPPVTEEPKEALSEQDADDLFTKDPFESEGTVADLPASSGGSVGTGEGGTNIELGPNSTANTTEAEDGVQAGVADSEEVASGVSKLASTETALGEGTAEAEEATGGVFTEFIVPAAAIAGIGLAIGSLFHHNHAPEDTAPVQNSIVGHATGISSAVTRGGYASAGLDSVTSLPSQNSAF